MRFFFPDSQDMIDPAFDFRLERYSSHRVRQRDDAYAHEVFADVPFDGLLVSKAIVDGDGQGSTGRYTISQRSRLYRQGVSRFFRLGETDGGPLLSMGDCGAFNYVKEERPPYSVDEVIDFYEECRFDLGISMDHVVLGFHREDEQLPGVASVPLDWEYRRKLTLELAAEFLERHASRKCRFDPVGAAQGWSPSSYAESVEDLQRFGYERIALGGMVSLKTPDILACLEAIDEVRLPLTEIHLLGVTRTEHIGRFSEYGVTSFDSTSPFRQSFKDDRDNYYVPDGAYTALRVPQVDANAKLKRRILAGEVSQTEALSLERECLESLWAHDKTQDLEGTVGALAAYERLFDGRKSRADRYRKTLRDAPWRSCPCEVCRGAGIDVAIFRGSERNKRRGFHNIWVFGHRMRRQLVTVGRD